MFLVGQLTTNTLTDSSLLCDRDTLSVLSCATRTSVRKVDPAMPSDPKMGP